VDTNNGVKGRRFIVLKRLNKLMTTPSYRHKSNKIKIGMTEMRVVDSEMRMRFKNEAWSIPDKSIVR